MSEQALFEEEIYARLASAGAMWPELQKTIAAVSSAVSPDEVKTLIIDRNLLAKATASNRQKVARKLLQRYTLNATDPVFARFKHEYERESAESQRGLMGYLMMSSNDALMRHLSTEWLAPKLSRPGQELTYDDLETALDDLAEEAPQVNEWADSTRTRIMQHYLGAVRDFGLAEGVQTKRVVPARVGCRPIAFAARLSVLQGLSGQALVGSEWFRLFGFDTGEAVNRLLDLNTAGLAQVRVRGDVIDIEFAEEVEPH